MCFSKFQLIRERLLVLCMQVGGWIKGRYTKKGICINQYMFKSRFYGLKSEHESKKMVHEAKVKCDDSDPQGLDFELMLQVGRQIMHGWGLPV